MSSRVSGSTDAGVLFVVATPIGNLGDLSIRAKEVLAGVDLIAAEDTRHTRQLLQACGIHTPLTSLHEHNETRKSEALARRLARGESVALVSDAGTPLISDPGFDLIAAAKKQDTRIVVVPGPCAAIAALCVAGLPTDRFSFEGFPPSKRAARRAWLERLAPQERTMVFYEAPHRLRELLDDMREILGADRPASISRELTKRFETTYTDTLAGLSRRAHEDADMSRGEIVLVVGGNPGISSARTPDTDRLLRVLLEELPPSQAAKIAARLTGERRSDLYERAMRERG
ncbi:tetrapyrrole methylase [Steroidobacter denitrificans]|uniref:Ribosomal RNA small subunit methyltransferase I n=1 Tax=Steroidobacter denitrificans TaxID=465721 RepID=A0A127F8E3_STEDE|nr:tetrapyrrole methylase [Steroidobacter denitrificans]